MKQITIGGIAAMAAALALVACETTRSCPMTEGVVTTAAGAYSGTLANDPAGATDFAGHRAG